MGDADFWSFELFIKELDTLIDHLNLRDRGFFLLGQSWGGVLAASYAMSRPQGKTPAGLRKLVIASGPSSIPLYDPLPEEIMAVFKNLSDDPTVYLTIQGPAEFVIVGSIKGWEGWKRAHNIEVETLLVNGKNDEVTNISMYPWFKSIPKVRWVTLGGSHMSHWEDRERYMQEVGDFLASTEPGDRKEI
ncbi:hypothetical protein FJTKL_09276 [Diaporthe vaccinii]|uniref:AB hydrolase-1 domain-containing protein n=1 Tax=Diaporthe vaccinii TaxID=105482 RepID=A0ABR4ENP6_9PEZI